MEASSRVHRCVEYTTMLDDCVCFLSRSKTRGRSCGISVCGLACEAPGVKVCEEGPVPEAEHRRRQRIPAKADIFISFRAGLDRAVCGQMHKRKLRPRIVGVCGSSMADHLCGEISRWRFPRAHCCMPFNECFICHTCRTCMST